MSPDYPTGTAAALDAASGRALRRRAIRILLDGGLTVGEAATALGVTARTIYRLKESDRRRRKAKRRSAPRPDPAADLAELRRMGADLADDG